MTGFQIRLATANRALHTLHDHRGQILYPRNQRKPVLLARSKTLSRSAPAFFGLRRPAAAAAISFPPLGLGLGRACHHRRRSSSSNNFNLLRKRREMASNHEIRRRSSAAERAILYDTSLSPASPTAMATSTSTITTSSSSSSSFSPIPDSTLAVVKDVQLSRQHLSDTTNNLSDTVSTNDDVCHLSSLQSTPTPLASRHVLPSAKLTPARNESTFTPRSANRFSLTLPITSSYTRDYPRPPSSAGLPPVAFSSKPPTPAPTPVLPALDDVEDFIIAIAAQERKVLELREELARAEAELASLKTQLTADGSMQKRAADIQSLSRTSPQLRSTTFEGPLSPARQSFDLDRKRQWLQFQQNTMEPPTQGGHRRVMRGSHTRTLSLLTPTRTDTMLDVGQASPPLKRMASPPLKQSPALSKRVSWQHTSQEQTTGSMQLMEDFKTGLRAFVEDIRQITIGDEPITGTPAPRHFSTTTTTTTTTPIGRTLDTTLQDRRNPTCKGPEGSKPSMLGRSITKSTLGPIKQSPISDSKTDDVISMPGKVKSSSKGKQFSWTPLGLEALDDNDWTNWDSPLTFKSSRWSGSTVHNTGVDETEAKPEKEETATPLKPLRLPQRLSQGNGMRNRKLDDLLPTMVNHLCPSNLQRTASNLMDEWEKSLLAPEARDEENNV